MGLDGQQRLVLLSAQAVLARALFAERQELTYRQAKIPQRSIVVFGQGGVVGEGWRRRRGRRRHGIGPVGATKLAADRSSSMPVESWRFRDRPI